MRCRVFASLNITSYIIHESQYDLSTFGRVAVNTEKKTSMERTKISTFLTLYVLCLLPVCVYLLLTLTLQLLSAYLSYCGIAICNAQIFDAYSLEYDRNKVKTLFLYFQMSNNSVSLSFLVNIRYILTALCNDTVNLEKLLKGEISTKVQPFLNRAIFI